MKVIDLHGLEVEDLIKVVSNVIYEFKLEKVQKIHFITGKGTGALKTSLENLLDSEGIYYSVHNNGGLYEIAFWDQNQNKQYYSYNEYSFDEYLADEEEIDDIFNDSLDRFKK